MANQLTYAPGSLETMTVQQAKDAGRYAEYQQLVSGFTGQTTTPVTNLGNTPPVTVPPAPDNSSTYKGALAGAVTATTPNPPAPTTTTDNSASALFDKYLKASETNQANQTSYEDTYNSLYDNAGIEDKTKLVNDLTSQLNTINANAVTAQQTLESQAGTGKDVTGQFLGRQQQEITRQAAIQALPVAAQLSAAQGNLTSAQNHLDTLFSLKMKDSQSKYEYNQKILDLTYQFADSQQKAELDKIKTASDNAFTLQRDNNGYAQDWAKTALENGQANIAAQIGALDPTSSTFTQDLASLTGKISTGGGAKAPTIQKINGVDMQWDGQKWINPTTGTTAPANVQKLATSKATIDQIDNIIESGGASAVGTSFLTRTPSGSGFWGTVGKGILNILKVPLTLGVGTVKDIYANLSGNQQNFIADVEQVRSNLNLEKLISAKAQGATFGALSDNELQVLASAGTKLGTWAVKDGNGKIVGYDTSESSFRTELDKINQLGKLDYLLKGGQPEDIGVIVNEDGTYWVRNSDGSLTQIM